MVNFSLILYSKNLKIAITKNGFDEKNFLAWIHLYYGKVYLKIEVPTLFYFVRVRMLPKSHVLAHKLKDFHQYKSFNLSIHYSGLVIAVKGALDPSWKQWICVEGALFVT